MDTQHPKSVTCDIANVEFVPRNERSNRELKPVFKHLSLGKFEQLIDG